MWVKFFFKYKVLNKNFNKIKNLLDICIEAQLEKNKEYLSRIYDDNKYENYEFRKEIDLELKVLENISDNAISSISKNYSNFKNYQFFKKFKVNEMHKISNLYTQFVGFELKRKKTVDQLVFDIKKKQLYSTLYKNMQIKKLITNGGILKELRIFVKKQKKNISVYSLNVKKLFGSIKNKDYLIELVGCKNQIFKIIKFIKKYYKRNSIFVFTPKRSFFQNQFKKLSSIKRKMTKKYNKSLSS